MTKHTRRLFSAEFKLEAEQLVLEKKLLCNRINPNYEHG